jgi:outer membrane receptor protein involved in Fe transport
VFWEDWKDFQFSFLGPNSLTVIANAGQAQIKGVETDISWRASEGLTLNGSASYTDAHLTSPYCKDPTNCAATLQAPDGQQLPITPKFKANATARYDWLAWGGMNAHVQGAVVYNGSAWEDLRTVERSIIGKQPAYTIANFAAGLGRDNWTVEFALENAFDERDQQYRYAECTPTVCGPETYIIPGRPRTFEIRFSQKFGG